MRGSFAGFVRTTVPVSSRGPNVDFAKMATPFLAACSTQSWFNTFEPARANAIIASCDSSGMRSAAGARRGSAEYTPSTSLQISQYSAFNAAANATAVVSVPPRPSVVISRVYDTPW